TGSRRSGRQGALELGETCRRTPKRAAGSSRRRWDDSSGRAPRPARYERAKAAHLGNIGSSGEGRRRRLASGETGPASDGVSDTGTQERRIACHGGGTDPRSPPARFHASNGRG